MRPTRLEILIRHAELERERSTCSRLNVGAVIHLNGRILSSGYNGAPSGVAHCDHSCNCPVKGDDAPHYSNCRSYQPCITASHAERNAIDWAARYGIRLMGAEVITTDTPCAQCAGSIINAGIMSVVAVNPYRDQTGVQWLEQAGVSMTLVRDMV